MTSFNLLAPSDAQQCGVWVKEQIITARQNVHEQFIRGLGASKSTALMTEQVQSVITALYQRAIGTTSPGAADLGIIAIGSLGRHELGPYSDIDIVLISRKPEDSQVRKAADAIFYPLWDANLDVGHAVRTPKDFARLVQTDETICTGAIDWRPIVGTAELVFELEKTLNNVLNLPSIRNEMRQSVADWLLDDENSAVYHMQPNIKYDVGGLRDVHRVWWAARLLWRINDWHELYTREYAARRDVLALLNGYDFLLAIRLALHFLNQRREDQLRAEFRSDVATQLGIIGVAERPVDDELLTRYFRCAREIRTSAQHVLARCHEAFSHDQLPKKKRVKGFVVIGKALFASEEQFNAEPIDILRIFQVAQQFELSIHPRASEYIASNCEKLLSPIVVKDSNVLRIFLEILADSQHGGLMLGRMHELGVLDCILPEIKYISGLPQREPFHIYTVDFHLIACVRNVAALLSDHKENTPKFINYIAKNVKRHHVLLIAALLHDIGKGYGQDHSEFGAELAQKILNRFAIEPDDCEDIGFLVREHLTMFRISQRRDLQDDALIANFAEQVQSIQRLNMLLLLSYADAIATGPTVWNDWKESLLHELYGRTIEVLRSGIEVQNMLARAERKRIELESKLIEELLPLRDFLKILTPRHLVSHRLEVMVRQLQAISQAHQRGETGVYCNIFYNNEQNHFEIIAVGKDRPGLLADLAGELAASSVSINSAQISTSKQNVAIDTFIVPALHYAALKSSGRREALIKRIEETLSGRCSYNERISERQRAAATLKKRSTLPLIRIIFDLNATDDATVVDLFAPDRVGLLHEAAKKICKAGASIILARVNTEAGLVEDAFYVVNANTGKPLKKTERENLQLHLETLLT
ncbi:MAG: [protein-PII] uridylyltransferase [Deltaproteobacteria bacterium]|nr:[protein-PII] uridylyltransferase [Deltaproteobacteria bacterium]